VFCCVLSQNITKWLCLMWHKHLDL
jgi:hypothetical protein